MSTQGEYYYDKETALVTVEVELMYKGGSEGCKRDAQIAAVRMLEDISIGGAGPNGVYRAEVKSVRIE